jgi:hypothetical protein
MISFCFLVTRREQIILSAFIFTPLSIPASVELLFLYYHQIVTSNYSNWTVPAGYTYRIVMLNWNLEKQAAQLWAGFDWLTVEANGGILWKQGQNLPVL